MILALMMAATIWAVVIVYLKFSKTGLSTYKASQEREARQQAYRQAKHELGMFNDRVGNTTFMTDELINEQIRLQLITDITKDLAA